MDRPPFSLWIETEHVADEIADFCNVILTHDDGRQWALNVWTYDFLSTAILNRESWSKIDDMYTMPPDLIVDNLSRATLQSVLADVVAHDAAPAHWHVDQKDELAFGLAVQISEKHHELAIAGKFGKVAGKSRDEKSGAVVSYAIAVFESRRVWSVDPIDVSPA